MITILTGGGGGEWEGGGEDVLSIVMLTIRRPIFCRQGCASQLMIDFITCIAFV